MLLGARQIRSLKVICNQQTNCCKWTGELGSLDAHLQSCDYALLPCTNECKMDNEIAKFLLKDLEDHLTNDCPRRQYKCLHCQETGEHEERTTAHLETCPKVEVTCSNLRCRDKFPRCEIITHQSMCKYEPVSCKYAKVGCETTPLRINLSKHEKNDKVHLRVTAEKVLELTDVVSKSNSTVPRTIRLTNYLKHKSDKDEFYGPPFYTSYNGYKMCLRVYANGWGTGEGTHVAVHAYLMKGDNDDSLSWPFPGTVTFELLNQLEDKNHYKWTTTFPADYACSRRVVDGERGRGYGSHKYISHTDLDYNVSKNTQYLKDDTLVFRVSVQIPDHKPWLE